MNRRRHANVIPLFSLATWVILCLAVGAGGLYYVNFKNQLLSRGTQIRVLEKKLSELKNDNEVAQAQIDKLASPNALRKRWDSDHNFLAGFVPIEQSRLVLYREKPTATNDLRPVSNDGR